MVLNNLKNMRTYLVGAMDRVADGGVGWRKAITLELEQMNIKVLNPCEKPIQNAKEDYNTRAEIEHYKETGQFEKIRQKYGHIRNADLRCVDVSDFIIAQIDIDTHMCGSYEEIVTANRQKKPILIWCKQGKHNVPNWLFFMMPHEHMFNTHHELISHLQKINTAKDKNSFSRWFFWD